MKKSLVICGVAALALASCTQSEVLDVPESRAINFNAFVNKNTRAVTALTNLTTDFYVIGYHTQTSGGDWSSPSDAFKNEPASTLYYWQPEDTYRFGAYADGSNGKIDNAEFDASTSTLTFDAYTPDDAKDLIAAVSGDESGALTGSTGSYSHNPVSLTFKHMLSQVKFTISTEAAAVYKLTISELNIDAINKGNGTYTSAAGASWDVSSFTESKGYSYTALANGGVISKDVPTSDVKLVLPQSNDGLKVTFKATIAGEKPSGQTTTEKTFEATLTYDHDSNGKKWMPGFCYNYTANVNIEDIIDNPDDLVKIVFTPSVDSWQEKDVPALNPTEKP